MRGELFGAFVRASWEKGVARIDCSSGRDSGSRLASAAADAAAVERGFVALPGAGLIAFPFSIPFSIGASETGGAKFPKRFGYLQEIRMNCSSGLEHFASL